MKNEELEIFEADLVDEDGNIVEIEKSSHCCENSCCCNMEKISVKKEHNSCGCSENNK